MDRQIPRGIDSRIIQVDSAFRRSEEPVNKYSIYFDSFDKRRSKIVKDVIGLRINKATVPKVHNNIIPGLNIVNLHVTEQTTNNSSDHIGSEAELIQYLRELSPGLVLTTKTKRIRNFPARGPDIVTETYQLSSTTGNQLLISSSSFPSSTLFENEHTMLVSSVPKTWNVTFPVTLNLSLAESHRILLKPGYYPTSSLIIGELFEAFATINSSINLNLQYYYEWNTTDTGTDTGADANGWSVYKEARGRWILYFRTLNVNNDMNIYFSKEPGEYNVLNQLGLRSTQLNNWASPTLSHKKDTQLFKMTKHTIGSTSSANSANTIIGRSTLDFSSVFEIQFEQINLSPRRYVDIIIKNIPNSSLITNSTTHNDIFARIDLAKHQISYSSNIDTTTQSNVNDSFDESSSSDTYAFYENFTTNKLPFFDPISIDHLEIELVDNMGYAYTSERDHTLEIELTVLGDATVPFDFPTNNIGSVSPKRRQLVELPEFPEHKPRRRHKNKKITIPEDPSPITDWIIDNRVEFGAGTFTFFTVLYIAHIIAMKGSVNV